MVIILGANRTTARRALELNHLAPVRTSALGLIGGWPRRVRRPGSHTHTRSTFFPTCYHITNHLAGSSKQAVTHARLRVPSLSLSISFSTSLNAPERLLAHLALPRLAASSDCPDSTRLETKAILARFGTATHNGVAIAQVNNNSPVLHRQL